MRIAFAKGVETQGSYYVEIFECRLQARVFLGLHDRMHYLCTHGMYFRITRLSKSRQMILETKSAYHTSLKPRYLIEKDAKGEIPKFVALTPKFACCLSAISS